MIYSENSINILTAMTYKGIGRAWIVKNLRGDETSRYHCELIEYRCKRRLSYNTG